MATLFTMNADVKTFDVTGASGSNGVEVHFDMNISPGDMLILTEPPRATLIEYVRITGYIRSDGRMYDTPAVSAVPFDLADPGNIGVRLLANDPDFNLSTPISYRVTFRSVRNGQTDDYRSWNTPAVPSVDTTIDLASYAPAPGLAVTGINAVRVDDLMDARAAGKAVVRSETQSDARAAIGAAAATDVVNVKNYGAKGDGSANDTAAINAAIAALSPGDVLYFPRGRYMTDGGHTIGVPSVTVRSHSGRAQTYNSSAQLFLRNGANADMLSVTAPQVTIRDLTLHGQFPGQTAASNGLVFPAGYAQNYFLLDAVWVTSFNGDGIKLGASTSGTYSGTMINCESRLNKGYGLNFAANCDDIMITNMYIDENDLSGIYCATGDLSLTSCHIWGNGKGTTGLRDGMTFAGSTGCRIVNSNIESNKGVGIRFQTGNNTGHIIAGCDIWGNSQQGIYGFGADHCVVASSTIRHNGYSRGAGANSAGIAYDSCKAMTITGNQFYGQSYQPSQTYGFYEIGSSNTDIYFRDNMCRAADHATGDVFLGPGTSVDVAQVAAPATATSPGVTGQVAYDNSYTYRCIATNTWRRSALSTW